MDRVAASEAAGRWFESSRARHLPAVHSGHIGNTLRRGGRLAYCCQVAGSPEAFNAWSIWLRASSAVGTASRLRATELRYRVSVFLLGAGFASSRSTAARASSISPTSQLSSLARWAACLAAATALSSLYTAS